MNQNFKNAISVAQSLLKDELSAVNEIIIEKMANDVSLIPTIAKHITASGGKRIRPIIHLLSAKMFGHSNNSHLLIAACIEFIHTATLLHDDVVDENHQRRGVLTSNHIWGNQASVLVGDYLFSKAFETMVETNSLEVLKVLSNASSIIAEGEVMQLSFMNDVNLSQENYLKIIFAKTAALFAASTKVAAILSKQPEEKIIAINNYASNLGIAFQIIDDVLDYSGSTIDLGKGIGTDFKEGKLTLPIILCLQEANALEKEFFVKAFANLNQEEQDFEKVLSYLHKYNSIGSSIDLANTYINKALEELKKIGINNTYNSCLENLAVSSLVRNN